MFNLLIVDDEIQAVRSVRDGIDWHKIGIDKVFSAYNIRQAKKILNESNVDIIICDIEMPQGNGVELLTWVKEKFPHIKSLFITCHADFEYAKSAINLNVANYLLKPLHFNELEQALEKIAEQIIEDKKTDQLIKTLRIYDNGDDSGADKPLVAKIKSYIATNRDAKLTREDVANHFHMNADYLNRIFKKDLGLTINEYLVQERIKIAKELLINTNMTISDIANFIGYSNFSYFSKMFKESTGLSPLKFRTKTKSENIGNL